MCLHLAEKQRALWGPAGEGPGHVTGAPTPWPHRLPEHPLPTVYRRIADNMRTWGRHTRSVPTLREECLRRGGPGSSSCQIGLCLRTDCWMSQHGSRRRPYPTTYVIFSTVPCSLQVRSHLVHGPCPACFQIAVPWHLLWPWPLHATDENSICEFCRGEFSERDVAEG